MAAKTVRFGVLGPITVWIDDVAVPLGGPKIVATLALLLAHGGGDTSVDCLVDALWGAAPPRSARDLVRWHVHKLRRLLPDEDRIVHRPNAYRLTAGPGEIDAAEFEQLYADGRQAARQRSFDTAADHFRAALQLWRGPAYTGVTGAARSVGSEALRLDELRLTVLEQKAAADLALGRDEAVVADLVAPVGEHPLRETLRARLMLALHRSGRRGDALAVYRDGRRLLVDELGVEPGAELRRVHQAILADATELPVRPATIAGRRPAELPAGPSVFVGRDRETDTLAAPWPVIAISGVGGVGKSALALRLAHRVADRFPDGQCHIDLGGSAGDESPLAAAEVARRILRSIGAELPGSARTCTDELAARLRSATVGRRLLVVLDDAADARQMQTLLPPGPGCEVIVTSRAVLGSLPGAHHHRLEPLDPEQRLGLLTELIGADRARTDPAAVATIAAHTDGLPLALIGAAARLWTNPRWPVAELAARLDDPVRRLDELSDDAGGIRRRFAASYQRLPDDAARLFRQLGAYCTQWPGPFDLRSVARLTTVDPGVVVTMLDRLVASQLVECLPGRRYQLLELVQLYAAECARAEDPTAYQRSANGSR